MAFIFEALCGKIMDNIVEEVICLNRQDFFKNFGKVSDTTFDEWISKGFLPGVRPTEDGTDWYIPNRTWPPYTQARAKTADAIYTSIIQGCLLRRRPCAAIYKCSEQEFDTYISALEEAGLITVVVDDGIRYYYATPKSETYAKRSKKEFGNFIQSCLSTIVEAGAKGVTEAAIQRYTTDPVVG